MWIQLLAFRAAQLTYLKTDQAFIDEWNNAIDTYGQVFSGSTLVATTGNGPPNFAGGLGSGDVLLQATVGGARTPAGISLQ